MYSNQHNKKTRLASDLPRIDITEHVRKFVLHLRRSGVGKFDTRTLTATMRMKEKLDNFSEVIYKLPPGDLGGSFSWGAQRVEFVPSNLGRGYLFYFRCNGCGYRVKYLYEYSTSDSPLCRVCCHLSYKQPSRRSRGISKILNRPYLSSEHKYWLIKQAGITVEDVAAAGIKASL